jgi:hypothetical protein
MTHAESVASPPVDADLTARLAALVRELAVRRGTLTLASGRPPS